MVRSIVIVFLSAVLAAAALGAEGGVSIERAVPEQAADRTRVGRSLYRHDFENRRDPDTGRLLPESAALGADGWPDFWEPVRAVGFPEYLIPAVRVVEDDSGQIPGAYRDLPNHALRLDFDGTRVGIRTRSPVPVDPGLAYEFSLLHKGDGLRGARLRTGVDWLRIDPAAAEVLRSDELPALSTGQTDWPVSPARMLINDPPAGANAARLFVIVDRRPDSVGGAYHAKVWLDDITLRPLPKIIVSAPRPASSGAGRVIPVQYSGLFDNIPDPDNPGYFKGRRYSRLVEITDVFGRPVNPEPGRREPVRAGDDGAAVEEVPSPRDRSGVYYFNIRLYDADNRLATDVMRAVAVMPPGKREDGLALRSRRPHFGVGVGDMPPSLLAVGGFLRSALERSGARMVKVVPWPRGGVDDGNAAAYYAALAGELRTLRSAGIGITGVIRPTPAMSPDGGIYAALTGEPQKLGDALREAGRVLGLFMDAWQWGDDSDGGLAFASGLDMEPFTAILRDFAGGLPVAATVRLGDAAGRFPLRPAVTQAFMGDDEAPGALWRLAAPVFPWLYEPFFNERGLIYPPRRLSVLASPPAGDLIEEQARRQARTGSWISLQPPPAYPHEPNAASERLQLEELAVKAVYAAALSPDTVFLGDLFDPERGLLRRDVMGVNMLETMARPALLAAGTVSEMLEGTEYLGEIRLLEPFEAHAFRRSGTDEAVIALWHNAAVDVVPLPRREMGEGPALEVTDWAGNTRPLPARIPVQRVPAYVTGLSASLVLTRMSLRINPEQKLLAQNRRQNQTLEMVNHTPRQTPVVVRMQYAARMPGGVMENGWTVRPDELRLNLAPFSPALAPGRMRYSVSPDPNSQIQTASPGAGDKTGLKIVRAEVRFNTTPQTEMTVYLPFRLRSDLDVDVEQLARMNDPHFVTLQLKLRWFPPETERRRDEIRVMPFYLKRGQMKESGAFPVAVKALPPEMRGNPDAPFEAVELRIPRRPGIQTWVGLDQVGGSNYHLTDVTDFILSD